MKIGRILWQYTLNRVHQIPVGCFEVKDCFRDIVDRCNALKVGKYFVPIF